MISDAHFEPTTRVDNTGPYIYVGESLKPGMMLDAPEWRIARVESSTNNVAYAGLGGFDQRWDLRASLTYTL